MPFREFGKNDLFYNQIKTFPKCDFIINEAKVYYNGSKNDVTLDEDDKVRNRIAPQNFISLFELNVNRRIDKGSNAPPDGKSIYPFITKDGARIAFKTVSTSQFDTTSQFAYGDVIKGDYPLTSSIKRIYFSETSVPFADINNSERFHGSYLKLTSNKRYINSLKNTFNQYAYLSHHYSFDDTTNPYANSSHDVGMCGWDKAQQYASLVEVPSIFYGSSIRKGSVVLQVFYTGSLAAECRDIKKDGELIQVSGTFDAARNANKVAGTVLYNEGFVHMTGSWSITNGPAGATATVDGGTEPIKWYNFAMGANDGNDKNNVPNNVTFRLSFEGINYVPTITMLAHAPKGEFNNSTNPTVYVKSQTKDPETSAVQYQEFKDLQFAKMEHSDYASTGSYKKQTYISKVGIYDDQKRLIGIAKLANPVRKTEDREYTFKLKLDI